MKLFFKNPFAYCLSFLVFLSFQIATLNAQTFQSKKGGVCLRFDDYQTPAELRKVRTLFNKHGVKFTYAMNTGIGEIFGDTAFWNVVRDIEKDGHELADQTPSDVSHYIEMKNAAEASAFVGRPGVDHVNSAISRVCLKYQLLTTNGSGDEGKVDISGNRIISKTAGEFAWSKLVNYRYTTHFYLPSLNKLVTFTDVRNVNPNDVDTVFVKSFWKEDIDLGVYSNVSYKKITPYEMSVDKEGIQTMLEYSLKLFAKYGLQNPVTFIHPGGAHPYTAKNIVKEAITPLGFKGAATYPFEKTGITYYNPLGLNQFSLQGGEITPEVNTIADCKKIIAEFYAKNTVTVSINHFTSLGSVYNFDQMLLNLEEIIIWCKANGIPIQTYKQWDQYYADDFLDQTDDIFPPLQNDFDKDGKPDGLAMANISMRDTLNGVPYNNNVCFSAASNGNVFSVTKLYGLNRGKNTIYVSTKNGKDMYDYFTMVVDLPEMNYSKTFTVLTNTANYTERSFDIEIPAGVTYINISFNCNTQNNQRLYASGFKIKSAKKPSFKTVVIERKSHEAFAPIDLTPYGACNGFTQGQLSYSVVRAPQNLYAKISNSKILTLLPSSNRFWIGLDSIDICVKAPDNTADTLRTYIVSKLGKTCTGQYVQISINADTLTDKSYAWSSRKTDPTLQLVNSTSTWAKPTVANGYMNSITFKSNAVRFDSTFVDLIPSKITYGPYQQLYFKGANSVSYTLNYPSQYSIQFSELPQSNLTVTTNGSTVTMTRPAGFSGNLETKLYVTTPTCDAIIYTLAASTAPVGLVEEDLNDKVIVYPNPVTNLLQVKGLEEANYLLEVYSIKGELIWKGSQNATHELSIATANWEAGFYLLKISSENQVVVKKILKVI
ncbi:MAG: hypothetical protein CFE21_11130 [Bacteroidetes bacterium B1(2017)]|nr:MAG: hypothetical protein CFE21_11130 [Bacteroidetes bacterium B1(2017)]